MARSVVTTRIKQLEDYVGAPLFHRSTRVVRLTDVSQAFQRDCTELVVRATDIVDQMRDVLGSLSGTLRIHFLRKSALGRGLSFIMQFKFHQSVAGQKQSSACRYLFTGLGQFC